MGAKNKPNELYITRLYDAPVKAVWDAWVDPEKVGKWWGPRGFTLTNIKKDVRTGGTWDYTMHGPDGKNYPNKTVYHEVVKYKKMVYDHGANDEQPPLFRVTVEFSEVGKKTLMEMTMALATPEAAKEIKKFIKSAGGDSTWDRLAEFLSDDDRFVINRSFETSIENMFKLWTTPEHFSQWLPPKGATMEFITADIQAGKSVFYKMISADGTPMYGKVNYLEITKPNRLVYTQGFCDQNQKVARHPMAPTWPEVMLTTVTFHEEGARRTRVTVEWVVHGNATDIERQTFSAAKGGMTMGWTGSFDKLEEGIVELGL